MFLWVTNFYSFEKIISVLHGIVLLYLLDFWNSTWKAKFLNQTLLVECRKKG